MLKPNRAVLLDVYSLSAFKQREEAATYDLNQLNGFWSPLCVNEGETQRGPNGTYAMVGGAIHRIFQAHLLGMLLSINGTQKFRLVTEGPNKGLADLKAFIEAGKVVPIVDKSFKLSQIS